jgi:hypothetical protein
VYPGNYTILLSACTVASPLYFQPVLLGGPFNLGAVIFSQAAPSAAIATLISMEVKQKAEQAAASAYYLNNSPHAGYGQHAPVSYHVGLAG